MTVRELIQTLIAETPDIDADVYIESEVDEIEMHCHEILNISSHGSSDSIVIEIAK